MSYNTVQGYPHTDKMANYGLLKQSITKDGNEFHIALKRLRKTQVEDRNVSKMSRCSCIIRSSAKSNSGFSGIHLN